MNILLSILIPFIESLGHKVQFDANFAPIIFIGLAVIIVVGVGLIVLIVLAIKFLTRIRKNRDKNV
jgi:hypothetical protein